MSEFRLSLHAFFWLLCHAEMNWRHVQMESHGWITFPKIGKQAPQGQSIHLKVNVSAAISTCDASPIAIFNDPKHTSGLSKAAYKELQINWLKTPAKFLISTQSRISASHELKYYLQSYVKPRTRRSWSMESEFWVNVTPECCTRYIDHLQKVLPVVITWEGRATGY